jgi:hypothetical protein
MILTPAFMPATLLLSDIVKLPAEKTANDFVQPHACRHASIFFAHN